MVKHTLHPLSILVTNFKRAQRRIFYTYTSAIEFMAVITLFFILILFIVEGTNSVLVHATVSAFPMVNVCYAVSLYSLLLVTLGIGLFYKQKLIQLLGCMIMLAICILFWVLGYAMYITYTHWNLTMLLLPTLGTVIGMAADYKRELLGSY